MSRRIGGQGQEDQQNDLNMTRAQRRSHSTYASGKLRRSLVAIYRNTPAGGPNLDPLLHIDEDTDNGHMVDGAFVIRTVNEVVLPKRSLLSPLLFPRSPVQTKPSRRQ